MGVKEAPAAYRVADTPPVEADVPPGYKRTEVGVVPEDWILKPLRRVLVGARLGGNYPSQSSETDFPLMKMGNVARGCFEVSRVEYVSQSVVPDAMHRLVRDDVIFNTRNTLDLVGKVGIWRNELPIAYFNSNLMRLEFDSSEVCSPAYANYALNSEGALTQLRALATGTTSVAAVYTRDLLELLIALPLAMEQSAIGDALSDADALIESLQQLIAKKRALKQGAMQALLLGHERLAGFNGEWQERPLGELGAFRKGQGVTRAQAASGDLPCVRYGEIYTIHDSFIRRFQSWISREVAADATEIGRGDVLFAASGETREEIGKCAVLIDDMIAYAGGDIIVFRPFEGAPAFYGYALNADYVAAQKTRRGQGDAVVHIGAAALAAIGLRLPSVAEQTAIAAVFSDMDAEIDTLAVRLAKTRDLKVGMMQALLTGRIRLPLGPAA